MRMTRDQVTRVADRQAGAASVGQLLHAGADRSWIQRQVTSGAWQRPVPGVVITHAGSVVWQARAWSAVLYVGAGAALGHAPAARALGIGRTEPPVVTVCVPATRRIAGQPGLRVRYRSTMPAVTAGLPVINIADTAVDLVSGARSVDDAVGRLCDAVRAGASPDAVLAAAARRIRVPRRTLLLELVGATADGVESALELRYGTRVEARHGLPRSDLQVRQKIGDRWIRADRVYDGIGVRVELDGVLAHPFGRTDADTWRDNEVLLTYSDITLRFRWSHVASSPCDVALLVARALHTRGWRESPRPCSPTCAVRRGPGPQARTTPQLARL